LGGIGVDTEELRVFVTDDERGTLDALGILRIR
jgi:hypothetical protein